MTFSTRPSRLIQYFGDDGRMTVDGLDFFDRLADESFGGSVPIGGIIDWSGAVADIPDRWALCDGTNGTPNLTGRFVIHADADSGGSYDVGDTGGAATVALTASQNGPHTHEFSGNQFTNTTTGGTANRITAITDGTSGTLSRTTTSSGSGSPHENMPPYYALAKIMRLR